MATIQGDTDLAVAYALLRDVAYAEQKEIVGLATTSSQRPDRKWILDTYAECLRAVRAPSERTTRPVR